jgi:hypothetical protein
MRLQLSDLAIRKLKPPVHGQAKYRDTVLPGFGIVVGKRTKTFFVTVGEQRRNITVGRYPNMNLAAARKAAISLMAQTPRKTRVERLPELVSLFLADCRNRLRPSSVAAYNTVLRHAPDIAVAKVTKTTVSVKTAHEIKSYKVLFNWAIREEITDRNPYQHLTARYGQKDRVLTPDEIKAVWAYDYPPYSTMVKLLLLTGQRRGQIWQYDPGWLKDDVIHFPGHAMKSGRSHQIPIGPLAKSLLPAEPFVFNGWSNAQVRIRKQTGVTGWSLHDLRRTYATLHASLGTPIHVIEAQLDHSSGLISGVAAIYNRYNYVEEMKAATAVYEKHLVDLLRLE